jgi:S-adenosylmethionine/arginine decarboxylase-like enzyme
MTHFMLDAYGVKATIKLNQTHFINAILNVILLDLNLKPISPAFLLPYDYGLVPLDEGLSSYIFLQGGHLTIHTFPLRGCYFVDLFTPITIDQKKLIATFQKYLPFAIKPSRSFMSLRQPATDEKFDPQDVFGPHVLATFTPKQPLTLLDTNQLLEGLIRDIGMTAITRSFSLYDNYQDPKYLSGIVMIAESHLSVHQNLKTGEVFFDIFSCKMFDYGSLKTRLGERFGKVHSFQVIARGEKHDPRSAQRKSKATLSTKVKKALNIWKD